MKKLKITIKVTKNGKQGYICSSDKSFNDFDLGGSGDTVEEAKNDCFTFYNTMKEVYPDANLPALEVNWVYDLPSFFNTYNFLNATKVAKYAGISPSNFRHYVAGSKPVTITQLTKIKESLQRLAEELKADSIAMAV